MKATKEKSRTYQRTGGAESTTVYSSVNSRRDENKPYQICCLHKSSLGERQKNVLSTGQQKMQCLCINNGFREQKQDKKRYTHCHKEKSSFRSLYLVSSQIAMSLNLMGLDFWFFHNCTHVTECYYHCQDLLLYFFEESIICMYTLILFPLNISFPISKFQTFEIFCNLCLIVYILYVTHRYVSIPSI